MEQVTVLLQGNYTEDTAKIIRIMKRIDPAINIVISCWDANRSQVRETCPEGARIAFSVDPGAPTIAGFKTDNIKRQIVSTRAGLELVQTPWVVKIRSDVLIDPRRILELTSLCELIPHGAERLFERKIVVTSLTTLDAARSGLYFHVCDWIYLGRTDDVRSIFSAPIPQDDFFVYFQSKKNITEICSRLRSETYLIFHLVEQRCKVSYPFSGYDDTELALLSERIVKTNFAVVNPWNLGLSSSKHKRLYLWLQPDRYSEINCKAFFARVGLVRAGRALIQDIISRFLTLLACALVIAKVRAKKWLT